MQNMMLMLSALLAAMLSGVAVVDPATATAAGEILRAKGPGRVIVTLGSQGAVTLDATGARHAPAKVVKVVDTTAAGDTFIGALAVALCEGQSLDDAVALGQAASALCVTRRGAQVSEALRPGVEHVDLTAQCAPASHGDVIETGEVAGPHTPQPASLEVLGGQQLGTLAVAVAGDGIDSDSHVKRGPR